VKLEVRECGECVNAGGGDGTWRPVLCCPKAAARWLGNNRESVTMLVG
jgi:hypothetical protein